MTTLYFIGELTDYMSSNHVTFAIQSYDNSLLASLILPLFTIDMPESNIYPQLYVTKRPGAIVRYSPEQDAIIEAEFWHPGDDHDFTSVSFLTELAFEAKPATVFLSEFGALDYVEGLRIAVNTDHIQGLKRYYFQVYAETSGLLIISSQNKMLGSALEINVQILNPYQSSWLDDRELDVVFTNPPETQISEDRVIAIAEGKEMTLKCVGYGCNSETAVLLLWKDVKIVKNVSLGVPYQGIRSLIYSVPGKEIIPIRFCSVYLV